MNGASSKEASLKGQRKRWDQKRQGPPKLFDVLPGAESGKFSTRRVGGDHWVGHRPVAAVAGARSQSEGSRVATGGIAKVVRPPALAMRV